MSEISGALPRNITETTLIKSGAGKVYGVVVNSHTNGTLKLVDGLYNGAAASGTLTSTGALVPASHATSVFTSTGVVVADETITIGSTVYKAVETPADAYDVAMGENAAAFLDNLKLAINGTGTAGTNYGVGTVAHPTVVATTNTDTAQTVVARLPGVAANTLATTETFTNGSWADTTLGGGTGDSNPGATTAAATVTIGNRTYTIVVELSETSGAAAVADQILYGGSVAVALDNLKAAINGSGLVGTDYSTGTTPHTQVVATTNSNTEQTVVAREIGTAGNAIATTETLANTAWGAATLASGTGSTGKVLANTFTFAAGSSSLIFPEPINFTTGLLAVIGGTADYTILYN